MSFEQEMFFRRSALSRDLSPRPVGSTAFSFVEMTLQDQGPVSASSASLLSKRN